MKKINLQQISSKISNYWSPGIVAEMNDYQIKIVKIKGDFVWHHHKKTDELFYVIEGKMSINFLDSSITLNKGELFIVPKGTEHKPSADEECVIMLIEPRGVRNTGNASGDLTSANDIWI
jgi:mannose-6-phosphate isomerase-like protein (cupin superfamily)